MASLVSIGSGNFTSSGTWGTVDSTSELDSSAGTVVIGTSNIDTATFTPGAITIDRISIKVYNRAASPSGTFTLTLRNSTDAVDVESVTINVSDFPALSPSNTGLGWLTIKLAGTQLLVAAKAYILRAVCSASGSQVTLWRNGTSNNFCRKLVTTTTAAPAASDHLTVTGQFTGAGAGSDFTVTFNNTASTSFGPTVSGGPPEGFVISSRGILTCEATAATAYRLRWKGEFLITGGGVMNIGSSGSRLPSDTTFLFECDGASATDTRFKVRDGGTFNVYCIIKQDFALMTTDKVATNTVIVLNGPLTGWLISDQVAFSPSTSQTHYERKTILTVDSSTQITLSAGLTNAHSGTSPTQSRVLNMTRNVKFTSVGTTNRGGFHFPGGTGVIHIEGMEFTSDYLGLNSGAFTGVNLQPSSVSSVVMKNISFNPSTNGTGNNNPMLTMQQGLAQLDNCTLDGVVSYDSANYHLRTDNNTDGTALIINNWSAIRNSDGTPLLHIKSRSMTFTNIYAVGAQSGTGVLQEYNGTELFATPDPAKWDTIECAWCSNGGFAWGAQATNAKCDFSLKSLKFWRNVGFGFRASQNIGYGLIDGLVAFANSQQNTQNAAVGVLYNADLIVVRNFFITGDATFITYTGITHWPGPGRANFLLENGEFANATSPYVALNWGVISYSNIAQSVTTVRMRNVKVNGVAVAATSGGAGTRLTDSSFASASHYEPENVNWIKVQRHDQTDGNNRSYWPNGNTTTDTVIYDVSSPSERLTPNNITWKLRSAEFAVPVDDGATPTISVRVRKSVSGDAGGANYNGNQPRLILRYNPAVHGATGDTVLATYASAGGSFNTLSAAIPSAAIADGVLRCYVDCDGTAGWINVDNWDAA